MWTSEPRILALPVRDHPRMMMMMTRHKLKIVIVNSAWQTAGSTRLEQRGWKPSCRPASCVRWMRASHGGRGGRSADGAAGIKRLPPVVKKHSPNGTAGQAR